MDMDNSQFKSALTEFEQLLQQDGIEKLYLMFQQDCEMLTGSELEKGETEFFFTDQNEHGTYVRIKECFSDKVNMALENAYKKTMERISNQVEIISNEENKKGVLKMLLDVIYYHIDSLQGIRMYHQEKLIKEWLVKLVAYIRDKYKSTNINHEVFKLTITKHIDTEDYFGFKGKYNELHNLHKLLIELNFILEDTTFEDFVESITSSDPQSCPIKLRINCDLGEAGYIIEQLKRLFYNLTDKKFVASNLFQTKQGKNLKHNSLHTARSRFIKSELNKDKIKTIEELFTRYFPYKK